MKFKSFVGKQVFVNGAILVFKDEHYETENQDEIKALSAALDVAEVKESKKGKADDSAQKDD